MRVSIDCCDAIFVDASTHLYEVTIRSYFLLVMTLHSYGLLKALLRLTRRSRAVFAQTYYLLPCCSEMTRK